LGHGSVSGSPAARHLPRTAHAAAAPAPFHHAPAALPLDGLIRFIGGRAGIGSLNNDLNLNTVGTTN
jgi:hypothetical protein